MKLVKIAFGNEVELNAPKNNVEELHVIIDIGGYDEKTGEDYFSAALVRETRTGEKLLTYGGTFGPENYMGHTGKTYSLDELLKMREAFMRSRIKGFDDNTSLRKELADEFLRSANNPPRFIQVK